MSKEELAVIEKFYKQFQELEKTKKKEFESIFSEGQQQDLLTTNGIFKM